MPPQLALLICILIILYLFWMDRKNNEGVSNTIWVPFIWMFLAGSRYVSQWMDLSAPVNPLYVDAYIEGNLVNAASFFILISVGFIVLMGRKLNWGEILKNNPWIWLYFLLGLVSIFWSDYPFVSFKRWIKTFGTVIMVLVIMTEGRPYEATGVLLRRLAFVLLPLSVLFIKYYPHLGRAYHSSGVQMFVGVTTQKNSLGSICLIFGIYFCWNLLFDHRNGIGLGRRLHLTIYLIILPMIAWLLYMANSATSLTCMVVAVCIFVLGRQPAVYRGPRRILTLGIACIILLGIMELAFDVSGALITLLGRRPDLTTRVPMWEELLAMVKNPIVGFGYESFWLGNRQQVMIERWAIPHNAHNGYLEIYLNLGLIGLFFMVGWILSGLRNVARHLVNDYSAALFRLCFIVVVVLYNWTEAIFYGVNNMWMIFIFSTLNILDNRRMSNSSNWAVIEAGHR